MTSNSKNDGALGCLIVVALVIAGIFYGGRSLIRNFELRPFADRLSEYTSISGLQRATSGAYISGKIITIDEKENEIDHIYFNLPKDLQASTPEEVDTVIWLEWGQQVAGTYTDGAKGYRITCQVTIIDMEKATIVSSKSFTGSNPPETKSGSGSRTGSGPTEDIIRYISTLPRR